MLILIINYRYSSFNIIIIIIILLGSAQLSIINNLNAATSCNQTALACFDFI